MEKDCTHVELAPVLWSCHTEESLVTWDIIIKRCFMRYFLLNFTTYIGNISFLYDLSFLKSTWSDYLDLHDSLQCNTKDGIFQKTWVLQYVVNQDHDYAFHIKDMGLFFLNVSINSMGHLEGSVQIANCTNVSKQFVYTLEILHVYNRTKPKDACYIGQVRLNLTLFICKWLAFFSDIFSSLYNFWVII